MGIIRRRSNTRLVPEILDFLDRVLAHGEEAVGAAHGPGSDSARTYGSATRIATTIAASANSRENCHRCWNWNQSDSYDWQYWR